MASNEPEFPTYVGKHIETFKDELRAIPGGKLLLNTPGFMFQFEAADVRAIKPHRTKENTSCIILSNRKIYVCSIPVEEIKEALEAALTDLEVGND